MIRWLLKTLRQKVSWLTEVVALHRKAIRHGRGLKAKQNNTKRIKPHDIIIFAVMKNEAHRLGFFLEYYRRLGINHFILIDNGSTDHFDEIVSGQTDISTFYTTASYKKANYGMYWLNFLLLRYGCGHWCLTCDPDEFFVYPYMDTRDLRDLTNYLDSLQESSMFAAMIDMYSDKAVEESYYPEGSDPLEVCSFFDSTGYVKSYGAKYRNTFLQGGVRRRVFYKEEPSMAPALNKIPLVKWRPHFAYIESMHMAIPRRLNQTLNGERTTGALLHFKFIQQLAAKVEEEEMAKQHWDNSSEYIKYGNAINDGTMLYDASVSVQYRDWRTLARLGLVHPGEW